MTDGKKITEYDEKDDGSQYNWLLHNQLCDAIDNQIITIRYQINFGNPDSIIKM